jgi:ABC-2 type transport system ATP-binding protein
LLRLMDGRNRFAAACSYGMRKKTAFAMAMLHGPKLLLLDEPFEGLDPVSCESVLALLLRAKERGMGIVVSSHMLMHVERLADEVVLLAGGRAAWRGATLAEGKLHEHYMRLIAAAPLPPLAWL